MLCKFCSEDIHRGRDCDKNSVAGVFASSLRGFNSISRIVERELRCNCRCAM